MPDLSVLLGLIGGVVVVIVSAICVVTGALLSVAGGIGVGLYCAGWIAWAYEELS